MKKYKDLISNSLIFALGDFTSKIILFILLPLYTSYLSTEEYGTVDIIQTTISLILPIATLSIISSVFRFSIEKESDNQKLMSNALVLLIIGLIVVILFSPLLSLFLNKEYILYFIIMYIFTCLNTLIAQFARGIGYTFHFAISGIISSAALIVVNVFTLVYLGLGAEGFLIAYIASNIASLIYLLIKCKMFNYLSIRYFNKSLLKEMLSYSIFIIPNSISWWLTQAFGRYMIAIHSGLAAAGIYAAASKLPAIINMLSSVFQQAWVYSSSKEINNSNKNIFYSNVFVGYSTLIFVSSAFVLPNVPLISFLILSKEFYNGWVYIPFLILAAVLGSFSYFFGTFYAAFKKNKMSMVSTLIGALVNVIFCLILLPLFGVFGVVAASVLSYAVILIVRIIDSRRLVKISIKWKNFILSFIILSLQSFILTIEMPYYFLSSYLLAGVMILIHFKLVYQIIWNLINMFFKKKVSNNTI
ncbi:O-antigen/teichoic acid export membrane protein [Planomicrobium sp. HSC-17F08]|nr:O-antigen/teichoic acid export membrane protein [Planomicrobium sp. HSC-17F08]